MATTNNDALAKLNDVVQRSMLTGVSTTEYNAALKSAGFSPDQWYEATQALNAAGYDTNKPTTSNILKYGGEIARTGVGNQSYAPGSNVKQDLTDRGFDSSIAGLDEYANNYYEQAQLADESNPFNKKMSALTAQMTALQKAYDTLVKKNTGVVGSTGGLTSGGQTVDTGGTNIDTGSAGGATTGPVYGPDGKMFSSAAAAIAAGVTNYSRTKPAGVISGADTLSPSTASRGFMANAANTGNVNPGGLIANQSQQLFNPQTNIQLPSGVKNPFGV